MRAVALKSAASEPQQDSGNDRYGPMSEALNRRAAVQAQMALAETLNARAPVQRMMQTEEEEEEEVAADPVTRLFAAIGAQAEQFQLVAWDNGEFISSTEVNKDPDFLRNAAHIHLYKGDSNVDDANGDALLAGHAVWAKHGNKQNRQRFTITAAKGEGGWTVEAPVLTEFQKELGDQNAGSKEKLLEIVNNELKDIFDLALNDEFR